MSDSAQTLPSVTASSCKASESNGLLTLSWSAPSGVTTPSYEVRYRSGDGEWMTHSLSQTKISITGLDAGDYEWQVRVLDTAGNASEWTTATSALSCSGSTTLSSYISSTGVYVLDGISTSNYVNISGSGNLTANGCSFKNYVSLANGVTATVTDSTFKSYLAVANTTTNLGGSGNVLTGTETFRLVNFTGNTDDLWNGVYTVNCATEGATPYIGLDGIIYTATINAAPEYITGGYRVKDDLTVAVSNTLTLEEGVDLECDGSSLNIYVEGTLQAHYATQADALSSTQKYSRLYVYDGGVLDFENANISLSGDFTKIEVQSGGVFTMKGGTLTSTWGTRVSSGGLLTLEGTDVTGYISLANGVTASVTDSTLKSYLAVANTTTNLGGSGNTFTGTETFRLVSFRGDTDHLWANGAYTVACATEGATPYIGLAGNIYTSTINAAPSFITGGYRVIESLAIAEGNTLTLADGITLECVDICPSVDVWGNFSAHYLNNADALRATEQCARITIYDGAILDLKNANISLKPSEDGGVIIADGGTLRMRGGVLTTGHTRLASGGFLDLKETKVNCSIDGEGTGQVILDEVTVAYYVYLEDGVELTASGCTFQDEVLLDDNVTMMATDCTFQDEVILGDNVMMMATDCTFQDEVILGDNVMMMATDCVFTNWLQVSCSSSCLKGSGNTFTGEETFWLSDFRGNTDDLWGAYKVDCAIEGAKPYVRLLGVFYTCTINVTPAEISGGYRLDGYATVVAGNTLTLAQNVNIEFGGYTFCDFYVEGRLEAHYLTVAEALSASTQRDAYLIVCDGGVVDFENANICLSFDISGVRVEKGGTLQMRGGLLDTGKTVTESGGVLSLSETIVKGSLFIAKDSNRVVVTGCDLSSATLSLTGSGSCLIDLSGNYWGTTDMEEILSRIQGYSVDNVIISYVLESAPETLFSYAVDMVKLSKMSNTSTSIVLKFNQEVDASSAAEGVQLLDSEGRGVALTGCEVNGRELTLHFAPLADGRYTVLANEKLMSTQGESFRASTALSDGVQYEVTTLKAPQVLLVRCNSTVTDHFRYFDLYFDQPLAEGCLNTSTVGIRDSQGQELAVTRVMQGVSAGGAAYARVYFDTATEQGDYVIHLDASISGLSGNTLEGGYTHKVYVSSPDLSVTEPATCSTSVIGREASITYSVSNVGDGKIEGDWVDTVYLCKSSVWDASQAVVLGRVSHKGEAVAAGSSYQATLKALLDDIVPGEYYLFVDANSGDIVNEVDLSNNMSSIGTKVELEVRQLEFGEVNAASTVSANEKLYYSFTAEESGTCCFRLNMTGGKLRVAEGSYPDAKASIGNLIAEGRQQNLYFEVEAGKTYYILAEPGKRGSYTATIEETHFSLISSPLTSIAVGRDVTMQVYGTCLNKATEFYLQDVEGNIYKPERVLLSSCVNATLSFCLPEELEPGKALTLYATDPAVSEPIALEQPLKVATYADSVDISFSTRMQGERHTVRVGWVWKAEMTVMNKAGYDVENAIILVTDTSDEFAMYYDYEDAKVRDRSALLLLCGNADQTQGVLSAGEKEKMGVYVKHFRSQEGAVQAWILSPDDTSILTAKDWTRIESALRPSGVSDEEWSAWWEDMKPRIGGTNADVASFIYAMQNHMHYTEGAKMGSSVADLTQQVMNSETRFVPSYVIRGSLVDNGGNTMGNVNVDLYKREDGKLVYLDSALTEDDGSYCFWGLQNGEYNLQTGFQLELDGVHSDSVNCNLNGADIVRELVAADSSDTSNEVGVRLVQGKDGVLYRLSVIENNLVLNCKNSEGVEISKIVSSEANISDWCIFWSERYDAVIYGWVEGKDNEAEVMMQVAKKTEDDLAYTEKIALTYDDKKDSLCKIYSSSEGKILYLTEKVDDTGINLFFNEVILDDSITLSEKSSQEGELTSYNETGFKYKNSYKLTVIPDKWSFEVGAEAKLNIDKDEKEIVVSAKVGGDTKIEFTLFGQPVSVKLDGDIKMGESKLTFSCQDKELTGTISASGEIKFTLGLEKIGLLILEPMWPGCSKFVENFEKISGFKVYFGGNLSYTYEGSGNISTWLFTRPKIYTQTSHKIELEPKVGLDALHVFGKASAEITYINGEYDNWEPSGDLGLVADIDMGIASLKLSASLDKGVQGEFTNKWGKSSSETSGDGQLPYVTSTCSLTGLTPQYEIAGDFDHNGELGAQVYLHNDSTVRIQLYDMNSCNKVGELVEIIPDEDMILFREESKIVSVSASTDGHDCLYMAYEGCVVDISTVSGSMSLEEINNWFARSYAIETLKTSITGEVTKLNQDKLHNYTTDSGVFDITRCTSGVEIYSLGGEQHLVWISNATGIYQVYSSYLDGLQWTTPDVIYSSSDELNNCSVEQTDSFVYLTFEQKTNVQESGTLQSTSFVFEWKGSEWCYNDHLNSRCANDAYDAFETRDIAPQMMTSGAGDGGGGGGREGSEFSRSNDTFLSRVLNWVAGKVNSAISTFVCDDWPEPQAELPHIPLNSWDPNEIYGPNGVGAANWVGCEQMDFQVACENIAEDNIAHAAMVTITEQLGEAFDWSSFTLGTMMLGGQYIEVAEGLQSYKGRIDMSSTLGVWVDVDAGIDLDTGLVTWSFIAIDPATGWVVSDPFTGLLAPNYNPPEGDGFVNYSVKPLDTVASGTTFDSQADIVFDFNEAIKTPTLTYTLDTVAAEATVQALAETGSGRFIRVDWLGKDEHSGVASYDVYVSVDGGEWELWRDDIAVTSALYAAQDGEHQYAFFATASDRVGNAEAVSEMESSEAVTKHTHSTGALTVSAEAKLINTSLKLSLLFSHAPEGTADWGSPAGPAWAELLCIPGVDLASGSFRYDAASRTLSWEGEVNPDTLSATLELQVAGDAICDASGNVLAPLSLRVEEDSTRSLAAADGATYAAPTWADVNGDGLADLLVGVKTAEGRGAIRVYLNTSAGLASGYDDMQLEDGSTLTVDASGCQGATVRLHDLNGDGTQELIVGMADGRVTYYTVSETEAGKWVEGGALTCLVAGKATTVKVDSRAAIDFADLDGDGSADLLVGTGEGYVAWYRGNGSGELMEGVYLYDAQGLIRPGERASISAADVDQDGLMDLLIGSSAGQVSYYRNLGAAGTPLFGEGVLVAGLDVSDVSDRLRLDVADVNGDGILDVVAGLSDGSVKTYLGKGTSAVISSMKVQTESAPDAPEGLAATTAAGGVTTFCWNAVEGISRYRLRFSIAGGEEQEVEVCAPADGQAVTHSLVLADGLCSWSVRSVTEAGSLSLVSEGQSLMVDGTAPAVPVVSTSAEVDAGKVSMTWAAVPADPSGVFYELRFKAADGGDWVTVKADGLSLTLPGELAAGDYTWQLRAVDGMGNASDWGAEQSFAIDAPAPVLTSTWAKGVVLNAEGGIASGYNDVNKTGDSDSYFCWAAVASNMLGWWQQQYQTTEALAITIPTDAAGIYARLVQNWENTSGLAAHGCMWWLSGSANDFAYSNYYGSHYTGSADEGGYYCQFYTANSVVESVTTTPAGGLTAAKLASNLAANFRLGGIAALNIYSSRGSSGFSGGHALTLWGVTCEAESGALTAIHVTDSDDDKDGVFSLAVSYDAASGYYRIAETVGSLQGYYIGSYTKLSKFTGRDVAPPVLTLAEPAVSKLGEGCSKVKLSWSCSESVTYTLMVNDVQVVLADGATSYEMELADGEHSYSLVATDAAGNASPTKVGRLTLDATSPVLTHRNVVTETISEGRTRVSFSWSCNENAAYTLTVDGEVISLAPGASSHTMELADGAHTWSVAATDAAGNCTTEQGSVLNFDTTAPAITFRTPVLEKLGDGKVRVTFSWDSDDESASYKLTVNGTEYSVTGCSHTLTLADGTYHYSLVATDAAGNSRQSGSQQLLLDSAAPSLSASLRSVESVEGGQVRATFVLASDDPSAAFRIEVNGTQYTPAADGSIVFDASSDGNYGYQVIVSDEAGNSSQTTGSFIHDASAPSLCLSEPALGKGSKGKTKVTLAWQGDTGATYTLVVDGKTVVKNKKKKLSWKGRLKDGEHSYVLTIRDAEGRETVLNDSFCTDGTAPRISLSAPDIVKVEEGRGQVTLYWASTEAATYTVTVDKKQSYTVTEARCMMELGEGKHSYSVVATDSYGNVSKKTTGKFTVDTTPVTLRKAKASVKKGKTPGSATVSLSWKGESKATYTVKVYDTMGTADTSDDTLVRTEANLRKSSVKLTNMAEKNGASAYRYTIEAWDQAGNASILHSTDPLVVDSVKPLFADLSAPAKKAIINTTATLSWTGVVGETYTLKVGKVTETIIGKGELITRSFAADGKYSYTLTAVDQGKNKASVKGSFTVDTTAPSLSKVSVKGGKVSGEEMQVTLSWKGESKAAYSLTGDGVSYSGKKTSSKLSLATGTHSYTLTATDLAGNASALSVTLTVDVAAKTVSVSTASAASRAVAAALDHELGVSAGDVCQSDSAAALAGAALSGLESETDKAEYRLLA